MTKPEQEADANAEQVRYWNEESGQKWVELQQLLDEQIAPLGLEAMDRAAVAAGESVLDVGCGCGETSLQLAERVGPSGSVTGLDISAPMLARARERASERGLAQVEFLNDDAQTSALEGGRRDLVFSRFGVMFFGDPVAAFRNLRGALRPKGRLAFVCWQELKRNPWMLVPLMAAAPHVTMPAPPAEGAPGPFSFADPERVRGILEAAGFAEVEISGREANLALAGGRDLDRAVDFILRMGPTGRVLQDAAPEARERARAAVRTALEPHLGPDGVRLDCATWVVSAVSPNSE